MDRRQTYAGKRFRERHREIQRCGTGWLVRAEIYDRERKERRSYRLHKASHRF